MSFDYALSGHLLAASRDRVWVRMGACIDPGHRLRDPTYRMRFANTLLERISENTGWQIKTPEEAIYLTCRSVPDILL